MIDEYIPELVEDIEMQERRLQGIPYAFIKAITEGFGDFVDSREWAQDDPTFGNGRAGMPVYYTSLSDRDDGKYLPVFQHEMDLQVIRAEARNVTAMSGNIIGALGTLTNYTMGAGFKFTAQQATTCPESMPADVVAALVKESQRVIDRFLLENKFQSNMDREIDYRAREDGETFVELSLSPMGEVRASFNEPEMIVQPGGGDIRAWENYLQDIDYGRFSPDRIYSWSFGVHCVRRTPDDPLGYFVRYDPSGMDEDYVLASRMVHIRRNVPRNVKRGVSDLYWIANDIQREAKIKRNTAEGAALQAAIAWIREHVAGIGPADASGVVAANAVSSRKQPTQNGGNRTVKQSKMRPGTVLDVSAGMQYKPGPMGSERNGNFILIAQYVARAIAARWAMPEFMFTSDASNGNYASTLVSESPFTKAREADQRFYGAAFTELMWKVLQLAHEAGKAFRNIENFDVLRQVIEITAQGPRVSTRDELQTIQRLQTEVQMGITSLDTAATEMGRDLKKEQLKGAKPLDPNAAQTPVEDVPVDGQQTPDGKPVTPAAPGGELLGLNLQQQRRVRKSRDEILNDYRSGKSDRATTTADLDGLGFSADKIALLLDNDPANDPPEQTDAPNAETEAVDESATDATESPVFKRSSTQLNMADAGYTRTQGMPDIRKVAAKIDDADLAGDGRETEYHVTVKYGVATQIPNDIARAVRGFGPVEATLGKTGYFASDRPGEPDVVFVKVESDDLMRLNDRLSRSLESEVPYRQYIPHLTLAYVKPGAGVKYADMPDLSGFKFNWSELQFSDRNGNTTNIPLIPDHITESAEEMMSQWEQYP